MCFDSTFSSFAPYTLAYRLYCTYLLDYAFKLGLYTLENLQGCICQCSSVKAKCLQTYLREIRDH